MPFGLLAAAFVEEIAGKYGGVVDSDLLCCPLRRRMFGHVEVQDPAAIMDKHDQDKKNPKCRRWHREEVNRHKFADVVVQERPPALRRRLRSSWHPSRDGSFGDVDPELEEFAVYSWCAP